MRRRSRRFRVDWPDSDGQGENSYDDGDDDDDCGGDDDGEVTANGASDTRR